MTVHEIVHGLVFNPALFEFYRDHLGEEIRELMTQEEFGMTFIIFLDIIHESNK